MVIKYKTEYSVTDNLNISTALDIAWTQWQTLSGTTNEKLTMVNSMFTGVIFNYINNKLVAMWL